MIKTRLKILLVEADPALRDLVTLVLSHDLHCQVITAGDGEEALELFAKHQPEIILLDILLPRLNGLDILRYLDEHGGLEHSSAIVISALGYQEIIQKAIHSGADDFLVKPLDVELLLQRVRCVLDNVLPPSPSEPVAPSDEPSPHISGSVETATVNEKAANQKVRPFRPLSVSANKT